MTDSQSPKIHKAFKIRLYPTTKQVILIDKTIGACRFLYNQMLNERIDVYSKLKDDKKALYSHKYKTVKQYRADFEFLKEVSSCALGESGRDLEKAYQNFYRQIRKREKAGFPKFKSKKLAKASYREQQYSTPKIDRIRFNEEKTKIRIMKLGFVRFRGLSKSFQGKILNVTIKRTKSNKYFATILTEIEEDKVKKERTSDNIIGIDLGLKEFVTCSSGEIIKGIKEKVYKIESRIKKQQRHLSRKKKGSKRYEKCKVKLNRIYEYRRNFLDHFQWALVNKLCSENQTISIESLSVKNMIKNKELSHAIHNINWSSFVSKLEQKAVEYDTEIWKVDRFFPSSKLCSKCGAVKSDLKLSDRQYICDCGLNLDRDINAAINMKKNYILNNKSAEYVDYKRGEIVRPTNLIYQFAGYFEEAFTGQLLIA